ncbi:hypothetical protein HK097_008046 [Rhizophlyctis rosea]|uniref:Kinesin motor domain-containing protein n=1 Tax=Rhizophlyctis rosea TaxID=64517 RepID=A0AAD5SJU5_9FUNG|nr:hypothetical protein HK097_008046 [Rhizophlyctis rosea]
MADQVPTNAAAVKVAIRSRPLNERERSTGQSNAWVIQGDTIYQPGNDNKPAQGTFYTFDKIFANGVPTGELYSSVAREIISSCLDGVNGTIFAYGQTSSGKTHTMLGTPEEYGIIPLAIADVFKRIMESPDVEFLLRISYLEIYNEVIRDLLKPGNDNLKIHESTTRGIYVGELTEHIVMSLADVEQAMMVGEGNRHVGETNMNEKSSRSHTILRMVIESREKSLDKPKDGRVSYSGVVRVSTLNLVDLAGSERVGHTGAEGIRLKEGGHINKSLLTLGTVISKLSDGGDRGHIPYRDSKLTRILQPSLGGNARTAIICTITPASFHVDETISTLKFASRAKTITNRPEVNEILTDEALIKQYRKEINNLKRQLDEIKNQDHRRELLALESQKMKAEEANETIQRRLKEQEEEKARLFSNLENMKKMILNESGNSVGVLAAAKKQRAVRRQTWFPGAKGFRQMDEEIDIDAQSEPSDRDESPAKRRKLGDGSAKTLSPLALGNKKQVAFVQKPQEESLRETTPTPSSDEKDTILQVLAKLCDGDRMSDEECSGLPVELQNLRNYVTSIRQAADEAQYVIDQSAKRHAEDVDYLQVEIDTLGQSCEEQMGRYEELVTILRSEIWKLKEQEGRAIAGAAEMEQLELQMKKLVQENESLKAVQQIPAVDEKSLAELEQERLANEDLKAKAEADQKAIASLKTQLEEALTQMEAIRQDRDGLQRQCQDAVQGCEEAVNERVSELQGNLAGVETKLVDVQRENAGMRRKVPELEAERDRESLEKSRLVEDLAIVQARFEEVDGAREKEVKEKAALMEALEKVRVEVGEMKGTHEEAVRALSEASKTQLGALQEQLELLKGELGVSQLRFEGMEREKVEIEEELRRLKVDASGVDETILHAVEELRQKLEVAKSSAATEKETADEQIKLLQAQLVEREGVIVKLEEELGVVKNELESTVRKKETADDASLKAMEDRLGQERKGWEERVQEKMAEINRLAEEFAQHREEVAASHEKLIAELTNQHESEQTVIEEKLRQAVAEKERIEGQFAALQKDAADRVDRVGGEMQQAIETVRAELTGNLEEVAAEKGRLESAIAEQKQASADREARVREEHLQILEKERAMWEEKLKSLIEERERLDVEVVGTLRDEVEKEKAAREGVVQQLEAARSEVERVMSVEEKLKSEVNRLTEELGAAVAGATNSMDVVERQARQIEDLNVQLSNVREKLIVGAESEEEIRSLLQQIQNLKDELLQTQSTVDEEREKSRGLAEEYGEKEKAWKLRLEESEGRTSSVKTRFEEMQKELLERQEELRKMEKLHEMNAEGNAREEVLQSEIGHLRMRIENMTVASNKKEEYILSLKGTIESLEVRCAELEEAAAGVGVATEELRVQLDESLRKCETLEVAMRHRDGKESKILEETAELRRQQAEMFKTIEDMESEIAQLVADVKSKNGTLILQESDLQEQRSKVLKLEADLQEAETARNEAQSRCETFEHDHKDVLQRHEELQQQYSENVTALARLRDTEEELRTSATKVTESQRAEVEDMRSRLVKAQEVNQQLQAELEESTARAIELHTNLEAARAQETDITAQAREIQQAFSAEMQELQQRLRENQDSLKRLHDELEDARAREAEAVEKSEELTLDHMNCEETIAALQARVHSLEEKRSDALKNSEAAGQEFNALKQHVKDLERQLHQYQVDVPRLEDNVRNVQEENESLLDVCNSSKETILSLKEELSDLSSAMERLEKRNQNLEAEKKELEDACASRDADMERLAEVLHKKMEETDVEAMSASLAIEKLREETHELKSKLSQYEDARTTLGGEVSAAHEQLRRLEEEHRRAKLLLTSQEAIIAEERRKTDEANQTASQYKQELERRVAESESIIAELRGELETISIEAEDLKRKLATQQSINAEILDKLNDGGSISQQDIMAMLSAQAQKAEEELVVLRREKKAAAEKLAQERSMHEKEKRRLLQYIDRIASDNKSASAAQAPIEPRCPISEKIKNPLEESVPAEEVSTPMHVLPRDLPEDCDGELLVLESVKNEYEKLRIENEKLKRELRTQSMVERNAKQEFEKCQRNLVQAQQEIERLKLHMTPAIKDDDESSAAENNPPVQSGNGANPTVAIRHGRTRLKETGESSSSTAEKDAPAPQPTRTRRTIRIGPNQPPKEEGNSQCAQQ